MLITPLFPHNYYQIVILNRNTYNAYNANDINARGNGTDKVCPSACCPNA